MMKLNDKIIYFLFYFYCLNPISTSHLQSQVVSDPLRLNGALDGLVLGGLRVFGVPSPPRYVLANGEKVSDFMYSSDTEVSYSPQKYNDANLQLCVCMSVSNFVSSSLAFYYS